jgi:hypothetical protein
MQENERVQRIWEWLQAIDKNNPTFVNAVVKSYIERLEPYKWMKTIMGASKDSKSFHSVNEHGFVEAEVFMPASPVKDVNMRTVSDEEYVKLIEQMHAACPTLKDYHVVLIPKENSPSTLNHPPPDTKTSKDM